MARNYDLNKLRLEVDDEGFILRGFTEDGRVSVVGFFDQPETITLSMFRNDVIDSYISQNEVVTYRKRGDPDASNPERAVIETVLTLKPGVNWFELDHSISNKCYN